MGRVAEGLFHPEQVKMIEIPVPSSTGATGAAGSRSGGSSRQPRDGTSDARRGEAASARSGGGQLFVAETSSAESLSKYRIQAPRLLFVAGDHLVSERVSHTTGEHFGYVVDTSHPATDKRPHQDKSKGYFRPEQVKIVEEVSPVGTLSSNKSSSPLAKRKTPDTPAVAVAAAVGGSDPDTDALLSRERKRTKIGTNPANHSGMLSASKGCGTSSKDNPHRKTLDGRFQPPPQKQQQSETKPKPKPKPEPEPEPEPKRISTAEANTNQARGTVVGGEGSRSITSTNSTNSKAATKGSMVEAKKTVSAPAKALAAKDGAVSKASSECAVSKASLECYVQAAPSMAAKARFPPGCVVIHTAPDGSTIAYTIRSVHLQLRSDQLISGLSNFDVLFKVGTEEDDKVLPEDSLMYARDCPILVKSDAVPHVKSQNGWVRGSVKSSIKLPGAVEEDYAVTIASGGTAHVSRDTIRYRHLTLSPSASVLSVSVPAPLVAIDLAPSPSSAAETATTETATEDASKASSSIATAPKKETDASATVVCRIDVPDRIAFVDIRKILAPHVEPMKRQLKVDVFTVGSDMPPPRDAGVVRSFGDLFPRPQTSGIYSSCILISGTAKYTEKARKAIIHYLKEGMHGANIDKQNTLDKELEDGCRKDKAITKGDDKGWSRAIKMEEDDGDDNGDDEDEPDVIYQPPSQEESEDEPEVVSRKGSRTIEILDFGTFIGNDWSQVKQWQNKFRSRRVKISVRVEEEIAVVSGPEIELERVVREINSWQRSRRRESADVVFGGLVAR